VSKEFIFGVYTQLIISVQSDWSKFFHTVHFGFVLGTFRLKPYLTKVEKKWKLFQKTEVSNEFIFGLYTQFGFGTKMTGVNFFAKRGTFFLYAGTFRLGRNLQKKWKSEKNLFQKTEVSKEFIFGLYTQLSFGTKILGTFFFSAGTFGLGRKKAKKLKKMEKIYFKKLKWAKNSSSDSTLIWFFTLLEGEKKKVYGVRFDSTIFGPFYEYFKKSLSEVILVI